MRPSQTQTPKIPKAFSEALPALNKMVMRLAPLVGREGCVSEGLTSEGGKKKKEGKGGKKEKRERKRVRERASQALLVASEAFPAAFDALSASSEALTYPSEARGGPLTSVLMQQTLFSVERRHQC